MVKDSKSTYSSSSSFEIEGQHASAKAHDADYHMARSCQVERRFHSRESNRQPLP